MMSYILVFLEVANNFHLMLKMQFFASSHNFWHMDESTKQLEELIKSIKDSVQSQQLSLSIQLLKCPLCDFSSNYNSSLKKHVSSIHGDPETCCGICKKYFKRSMLQEHKQLIHSYNGREFKCSLCDYSSKSNQSFKYHVSSIHGDPDHKCLICKKMFKKSTLRR